jgi:muramoyltetrapeptide carboxypeptidase
LVGLHGALFDHGNGCIAEETIASLRSALMTSETVSIHARDDEPTAALTTGGAARGRLIGGNLDMIVTAAGWALPDLSGAILLLEAVDMYLGQVDRQLTMLHKADHLSGLAGIAIGQFTKFKSNGKLTVIDLLRDHLGKLGVPILGGLPLGHGNRPVTVPVGAMAFLDADSRKLTVSGGPGLEGDSGNDATQGPDLRHLESGASRNQRVPFRSGRPDQHASTRLFPSRSSRRPA